MFVKTHRNFRIVPSRCLLFQVPLWCFDPPRLIWWSCCKRKFFCFFFWSQPTSSLVSTPFVETRGKWKQKIVVASFSYAASVCLLTLGHPSALSTRDHTNRALEGRCKFLFYLTFNFWLCVSCVTFRKEINKDIGVENLHYLNDGLWKTPALD